MLAARAQDARQRACSGAPAELFPEPEHCDPRACHVWCRSLPPCGPAQLMPNSRRHQKRTCMPVSGAAPSGHVHGNVRYGRGAAVRWQAGVGGTAHRREEEGDDDEPDDVVGEGGEGLAKAERLGGDRGGHRQERPRPRGQRLQHQPCTGFPVHLVQPRTTASAGLTAGFSIIVHTPLRTCDPVPM